MTAFFLGVVRQRQRLQRLADFVVHDRIEEAHALHVGQLHAPHAVGAPQVQLLRFHRFFAGRDLLLLDAHDGAGHCAGLRGVGLLQNDFDLFAARPG